MTRALALLVLSLFVAGCAEEAATVAPVEPTVLVVTSVDDTESLTNESLQMQSHQHDYWDGKERLVIIDETAQAGRTFFIGAYRDFEMRPPPGRVVPQGTARVEITPTWRDVSVSHYEDPEVWVITAADHEPVLVGPAEQGKTLVVETTLANADLPHQSLSAWRFYFRIHDGAGNFLRWDGEFSLRVEAVRGLDIPVYPPHPDLWGGREAIDVMATGQEFGAWQGSATEGGNCYGQCPPIHRLDNGSIVPYDAAALEVVFEEGADSVTHLGLQYHGANTWVWMELQPTSVEGSKRTYLIPVKLGEGDSPYASQSQWEFAPFIESPERDSFKIGSYVLTARVLRAS